MMKISIFQKANKIQVNEKDNNGNNIVRGGERRLSNRVAAYTCSTILREMLRNGATYKELVDFVRDKDVEKVVEEMLKLRIEG